MTNFKFNGVELTEETITKTRKHFSDIALSCIEGAKNGEFHVNNLERYIEQNLEKSKEYLEGSHQVTFTFLQRAYYLQTGESLALLSK